MDHIELINLVFYRPVAHWNMAGSPSPFPLSWDGGKASMAKDPQSPEARWVVPSSQTLLSNNWGAGLWNIQHPSTSCVSLIHFIFITEWVLIPVVGRRIFCKSYPRSSFKSTSPRMRNAGAKEVVAVRKTAVLFQCKKMDGWFPFV